MGLLKQLKEKSIVKSLQNDINQRRIVIPASKNVKSILICLKEYSDQPISEVQNHFPQAIIEVIYTISLGKDIVNPPHSHFYSSKLLGFSHFKSNEIEKLLLTPFDVLIDFTELPTDIDYFVKNNISMLKVGFISSKKNYLYDLLIQTDSNIHESMSQLVKQLNMLSNGK